jgi:hypothetical protein
MIVKNADDKGPALATLESLRVHAEPKKQKYIDDEIRMLRAGIKGEQESAYHIDFDFRESEITSVIHDLRLEMGGRVAQIDHLIIHRTQKFYVLETKSFSHGLKITDEGEFLRWNDWKKTYEGMPSPIEQNRRHVEVLRYVLVRMGYANPEIESFILVSPAARIDRSKLHPCPEVVKADQFTTKFKKRYLASVSTVSGIFNGLSKGLFGASAGAIAKDLVRLHKPITIDYKAKFGLQEDLIGSAQVPVVSSTATSKIPAVVVAKSAPTVATVVEEKISGPSCKACGGTTLAVEYGKFGYYFKCKSCDANTALKINCGVVGHKEKIRKSKLTFYRECEECKSSSVFHVNDA